MSQPESPTATDPQRTRTRDRSGAADVDIDRIVRGTSIGRYVVLDCIGTGGMGAVYAAYDPELDRRVAIKLVDAGTGARAEVAAARLLREAQALARVNHPNVVAVHDVGTFGGEVFIAMELVGGARLDHWLRKGTRTLPEIIDVFRQAGRGLAAAHAAGLVHRDFKPANVLVDEHGRVRVLDFGIARAVEWSPRASDEVPIVLAQGKTPLEASLTRAGITMGTPAYMAPEQHLGIAPDARVDQFGLCVALFEALFGARPFSGETESELSAAILGGKVAWPDDTSRVPARILAVLRRGFAREPNDRFASMDALVDALAPPRERRWLAPVAVAATSIAAVAIVVNAGGVEPPCRGGAALVETTWNDARRDELRQVFAGRPAPIAAAAPTVEHALDEWTQAWAVQHAEACTATTVRGEQSADMLDRRMACLQDRRHKLDATITLLATGNAAALDKAPEIVRRLPDLQHCADTAALAGAAALPEDVATRAAIDHARDAIADAEAQLAADRHTDARLALMPAVAIVAVLDYAPVQSEVWFLQGRIARLLGDTGSAAASLFQAAELAAGGGTPDLEARAWVELVGTIGDTAARPAEGFVLAHAATAALARTTAGAPRLRAALDTTLGLVHARAGDYEQAAVLHERALADRRALLGPDHPDVAVALNNLGLARESLAQFDEAIAAHREALAIRERIFGADHPQIAISLTNLGYSLAYMGMLEEAESHLQRALAIQTEVHGEDHPHVALVLAGLGTVHQYTDEPEQALADYRAARAIFERHHGRVHADVAAALNNEAVVLTTLGRFDEARAAHERTLAIRESVFGPIHHEVSKSLSGLGTIALAQGDLVGARRFLERALAIKEQVLPAEHFGLTTTLEALGRVERGNGRTAEARAYFERAHAIAVAHGSPDAPMLAAAIAALE